MTTNLTNITNANNAYELTLAINNAGGGLLFIALIAITWIMLFTMILKTSTPLTAVRSATTVCAIASFLIYLLGGFSDQIFWAIVALSGLIMLFAILKGE